MATRKRRKKDNPLDNVVNIVSAGALVVIAILLVVFVGLYIKNNLSFSSLLPGGNEAETGESTDGDESAPAEETDPGYGLITLADGRIVYAMTAREAAAYDDEYILDAGSVEGGTADGTRYYLADSWLDYDYGLYHFDGEGVAAADEEYSERAFVYHFDETGRADGISYNSRYTESPVSGYESYPGIFQTKSLWAYMDEAETLYNYVAVMYKKATESEPHPLGAESARQYSSPYAYEIIDKDIYYLAVSGASGSGADSGGIDNIEGKVFRMNAGADTRYICAEDSVGFKALKTADGSVVVYSYDGQRLHRSDTAEKDDSMVVFTEDLSYRVSIDGDKAFLELTGGQRVTLASSAFKAGNFTYALSSDGEILSVADKTTVNTGGYTYFVQHGTSFGSPRSRVIRRSSDGDDEVISSEFDGTTANLHYDYDSASMIAEYTDSSGNGGLLKISLDGDVDIIADATSLTGPVTLYAIQESTAVLKRTEDGSDIFYTARINASSPLAVAIDPVPATEGSGEAEIADSPAAVDGNAGTAETSSAPTETPSEGTSVGNGPGGGDTGYDGVIYAYPESSTTGPGGN